MAIRIIKNPRYRVEISNEYKKEIIGFFKYKKDARKKANKLKEKYQTTTSKGAVEHEKSLRVVKEAKKLLKIIAPKPSPKPKKPSVLKITFPTEWKTSRGQNIKVKPPGPGLISRTQITKVAGVHPQFVDCKKASYKKGQYWFYYAQAVKEVERLKVWKVKQEASKKKSAALRARYEANKKRLRKEKSGAY